MIEITVSGAWASRIVQLCQEHKWPFIVVSHQSLIVNNTDDVLGTATIIMGLGLEACLKRFVVTVVDDGKWSIHA